MGDSAVMLRYAQHLDAQRDRPFASLRVTVEGPISSPVLFTETALSALGGYSAILINVLKDKKQHAHQKTMDELEK
jgi:hypothetical protein